MHFNQEVMFILDINLFHLLLSKFLKPMKLQKENKAVNKTECNSTSIFTRNNSMNNLSLSKNKATLIVINILYQLNNSEFR